MFVPDQHPEKQTAERMQNGQDEQAAQSSAAAEISQRDQPVEHQQPDNPGKFEPSEIKIAGEQGVRLIP